ncbi:MAG: hypothetical protein KJ070_16185 [Verrucomicrobia bacterium]|nr:hypothetical protein [Verrucomicrobiota bacterium]
MTADKIAGVIAVGQGGVAATRAVRVVFGVLLATVVGRTLSGVGCGDAERVFIHVAAVDMMQVSRVEIVGVAVMNDGDMAAAGLMPVSVSLIMGPMNLTAEAGECRQKSE